LNNKDPLTVSALARHLDVTESTISIQLDKLQRAGYVRRHRDQRDGRRVRVLLTAVGRRVQDGNSVLDPDLVRRLIACLRPGEVETALKGLELLGEAADRLVRQRPLNRRQRTK
jgi:DNA-binding MarR family transcriptional regulator